MFRPYFIIALVVVMATGAFASGVQEIDPDAAARTPESVRVAALKGPTAVAIAKLMNEAPGVVPGTEITYELATSPQVLVGKLVSGEVDVATIPTNLAAQLYNRGVDIKLAAITIWGVLYVVSTDDSLDDWDDLSGRTVYSLGRGSTPDVVFRYLSEVNGLSSGTDYTLDFSYNQVELSQMMIAGRVQTAVLPEPFVSNVLSQNSRARIALDLQQEWREAQQQEEAFAQTCVVVSTRLATEYPDTVVEILGAIERSVAWAVGNPIAASQLVGDLDLGISPSVAVQAIPRFNLAYVDGDNARYHAKNYLEVLFEYSPESVGQKLPDDDFYLTIR